MRVCSGHKKIKKDYQCKNLHNPFFHKKAKAERHWSWKWILFCTLGLLALATWFFLAAPFWRLREIKIIGLTRLSNAELEKVILDEAGNRRGLFFREDNLILFKRQAVTDKIITTYNFSDAQIKKKWPRTLELTVTERPYAFIFQEGSAYYYASSDAYVIKEPAVSEADKTKYFILENKNPDTLVAGTKKINIKNDYLNFIFSLSGRLGAYPELPAERFIIDHEFNTIKVKFVSGPTVFFNIKEPAELQVDRLLLVKREKIKDNFSKTDYIDLRYGDKIFINPSFN